MNQPEQYPQRYDDEISLVDLATTFIRRRNVFFVVFALVVIAALGCVLLSDKAPSASYVTTLRLAELPKFDNEGTRSDFERLQAKEWKPSERVNTVLAIIDSRWLPQAQDFLAGEGGVGRVEAEAVEGTELVSLTTVGVNLNADDVRAAHQVLADLIVGHENEKLASRSGLLEDEVANMENVIASHGPSSVVAAQAIETRARLQQKIATGEPAEVLSLARESAGGESGPSAKLILALAIVLGGMLGIFAAFMAEFASHVRMAMKENG